MVNPRHQTPQGQSVAKPETPLQNIQVELLNVTLRDPMAPCHLKLICSFLILTLYAYVIGSLCRAHKKRWYWQTIRRREQMFVSIDLMWPVSNLIILMCHLCVWSLCARLCSSMVGILLLRPTRSLLWFILSVPMCINLAMCMLMLLFHNWSAKFSLYVSTKFLLTLFGNRYSLLKSPLN